MEGAVGPRRGSRSGRHSQRVPAAGQRRHTPAAAAIVATLVVLYNLWVKVVIPTWDALVNAWDWTVDAIDAIKDLIVEYIIDPIKSVKKKIRRKYFQTDLENIIEDRDDMRKAADSI